MKKFAVLGVALLPLMVMAVEREASWVIPDLMMLDADGDSIADQNDRCPTSALGSIVGSDGCALVVERAGRLQLNIRFDTDMAVIKPEYQPELARFAAAINAEGAVIELRGHADLRGSEAYNQVLSERRAQAVFDALVADYGVEPGQLTVAGYSERQPLATGTGADQLALNRRVQADILDFNTGDQFETIKTRSN
ncbi:MAG: OmpA family protein [Litorivicinus sp.]